LFAFHLPLDAHAELGNNAQLGLRMGWRATGRFAEQDLGFLGSAEGSAGEIAARLAAVLDRQPLLVGDEQRPVRCIAWCSGAAQGFFEQAIAAGADLYVSGELSEQTTHLARESGVPYIAAGHHASERFGVQALAAHLAERFGLACDYLELDNPA
ncbi:MAG TPA: Nif3-like dinuclear metal center hexameric protein, partial [Candidatus Desulfobacillus sp.]|nr:Nif3-like dinuclear metal center hexameric protein [Candidatus Desulfobacillus sp.]